MQLNIQCMYITVMSEVQIEISGVYNPIAVVGLWSENIVARKVYKLRNVLLLHVYLPHASQASNFPQENGRR